ncbi:MAG: hypothetical protein HPY66_3574 [Firmicutes bacterium]|nr:hypothetical protein [Bacillota bacterium]MDI6641708.1 hypothetical protein [Elusimicrobiota bacterium]
MRKKIYLVYLITTALFLTSCSYNAVTGINVLDLPWEKLTLRHFVQFPIILFILYLPVGLHINYTEIFRTKWAGKKIMKMKLKNFNLPFWFVLLALVGSIWLVYIGVNNDIQFYMESDLPQEVIEEIILLKILGESAALVTLLHFGFLLILRFLRQPEIRGKGIIYGLLFLRWDEIYSAEWEEPGKLKIHCRWTPKPYPLFFWKKNKKQIEKEANFYLLIKPEQEAEANRHLQKYIPNRITGR